MHSGTKLKHEWCSALRRLTSRLHIIFAFFLIKLSLLFRSSILILLVFGHKIVHVALSFSELHLVHALTCVPVEECLAPEHRCEVLGDSLEHLLNGCRVTGKRHSHLQALRWNVADA